MSTSIQDHQAFFTTKAFHNWYRMQKALKLRSTSRKNEVFNDLHKVTFSGITQENFIVTLTLEINNAQKFAIIRFTCDDENFSGGFSKINGFYKKYRYKKWNIDYPTEFLEDMISAHADSFIFAVNRSIKNLLKESRQP